MILEGMSERRSYSDEEKAEALAALDANAGDAEATARATGIPRTTIMSWASRGVPERVTQLRQGKKEDLADRFEEIARQLVDAIPAKIASAPLQAVATSAAIAVDKMRLLREQATSINRDDGITDEDRVRGVVTLLERARARRDGQAPGADPAIN